MGREKNLASCRAQPRCRIVSPLDTGLLPLTFTKLGHQNSVRSFRSSKGLYPSKGFFYREGG